MAPAQEVEPHAIDRTPEYEDFMKRLQDYHNERGTILDPEPKVGLTHIDLFKVFNHIVASGGYDKVSEEKLAWRRMAAELGLFSNNEASTAFALKEKFYKNLAAFEIKTVHGKEPPPKEILEDVTAKGANLLSRTIDNFRGKRESNIGGNDSAASGDDGTPARERPPPTDVSSSGRASRGLREAPAQRVIFQPDTGSSRSTRQASQHAANALATGVSHSQVPIPHNGMPPMPQNAHNSRGPSIMHHPERGENTSTIVTAYQPRHMKPLQLRAVPTPSNAPTEFLHTRLPHRLAQLANRPPMLPGTGFEGPNIYTRCLNALRSRIPEEQAFALNHLVKISFERGDKYKFDSFPGLAEGLVDKVLEVGNLFYHVNWRVSWDFDADDSEIGCLNGNVGTPDILDRIDALIERDIPDVLQTESYVDQMTLITEALLTIRNMVTLAENAYNMSEFPPIKDVVCIILHLPPKDSLVELKHLALDIAEQITPFMVLGSDDPLYTTLLGLMVSEDRGTILTSLRALGRISVNLEATNRLDNVPEAIIQRILSWLLLNDDELTDACLDFLYQYTAVVPNVEHMIHAIQPEALVDQLVRLLAHGARKVQHDFIITPEQRLPSRNEVAPMPADLLSEMLKLEEPDRVHQWVKCFFEEDGESFVTQLAAWQAYQNAFVGPLKANGQTMITPADFIRNSTSVYPGSNAQVLREQGDGQQKFIIHGIRARVRPMSLTGKEYGRCLWASDPAKKNAKCGRFCLTAEQMWNHVVDDHLHAEKNEDGQYQNVEQDFQCTWGDCSRYNEPARMHLQDFARHIMSHISTVLPAESSKKQAWLIPAKTMTVTFEETMTVLDERNPRLPPQAAGIPLSAVLVLRNIARNIVKTESEEALLKQQKSSGQKGGWNEKLFRAYQPRLFEILAENRPMSQYIASLLELIAIEVDESDED